MSNNCLIIVVQYKLTCVFRCVQNCAKDETLPNEVLFLKAKVSVIGKSKSKVNKSMKFNWVYSKENDSVLHPVDSILLTTDLPTSMLAIKEGSFKQGVSYTIMLRGKFKHILVGYNMDLPKSHKTEVFNNLINCKTVDFNC